jgi:hypothetical protein
MPFRQSLRRIMKRPDLTPATKLIYLCLLDGEILHITDMCERTSMPRSSVYYNCQRLVEEKLIKAGNGFVWLPWVRV